MKTLLKLFIFHFSIFTFFACNPQTVSSEFKDLPHEGWHADSVLDFAYSITDAAHYDILLYLRHTDKYPYQNCWLFMGNDTIEFYLADQRGRWLGNGFGRVKEMPVLYQENILLDTGTYHLRVWQGMREETLRGVESVGLEIVRHGKE